jgi:HK97 family phage portal protein
MSFLGTDREPRFGAASLENPSVSLADPNAYEQIFGAGMRAAGMNVTPQTALGFAAVYACVRVRAESFATLPLQVFRREGEGRKLAKDLPLYYLLHDRPNPFISSSLWRKRISADIDLWGNHYSLINMSRSGQVLGLYPIQPWLVEPKRTAGQGIVYEVQQEDGGVRRIPYDEILHIADGQTFDGLKGHSPITLLRNAVGIGMAAEHFASDFYENDGRPGTVIETAQGTNQKQGDQIKSEMDRKFTGPGKKWKTMVLGPGLKLHTIQMPLADAQFLETRKFQVIEIARMYRVPPHLIADLDKATFSNIEQQDIGLVKHTVRPMCVDFEQEANFKLFSERSDAFCELNLDGLLRGDFKTRMEGYQVGVNAGFFSRDEVRQLENFDSKPELKPFLVQGAMVAVKPDGTLDKPEPKPAAAPADKPAEKPAA